MAVTLFRKRKVINNIVIKNGVKKREENDNTQTTPAQQVQAKIRGRMYDRRTINR